MEETFTQILGIIMIYATTHMFFIHYKNPSERTSYEKAVSIAGIVSVALVFIGVIAGN